MTFFYAYVGSSEVGTDRFRISQNRMITFGHLGDRSLAADQWLNGYFARVCFLTMHVLAALKCCSVTVMQLHTD